MDHFVFTLRPESVSEPFILLMSNSLPLSPHSALHTAELHSIWRFQQRSSALGGWHHHGCAQLRPVPFRG